MERKVALSSKPLAATALRHRIAPGDSFAIPVPYTCDMTAKQVNINARWRNTLIIVVFTVIGFYAGGGYRLHNTQLGELFVRHHSQGDDLGTDIISYTTMFIFCGGAGAMAGAGLSSLALFALSKRKKT